MTSLRDYAPFVLYACIAFAVTLPVALDEPRNFQSFWINAVWLEQFSTQLASGHAYPRWLPESHNGLGSPVFYYYPPLSFYIASVPALLGLSPYLASMAAFGFGCFASGLTMHLWLKGAEFRVPASAIFMVMPYHLFDLVYRGALAEYMGIALIPLIAMGLKKRPVLLAFAYAGLIATHLPLALLVSLFMILPYGAWLAWKDRSHFNLAAIGLSLGLLISGIYLFPALALDEFRKTDELYRFANLQTTSWNFFDPDGWATPGVMQRIIGITALLAFGALFAVRRGSFWPILSITVCVLVSGLLPIWHLPLLADVQFPWRALPIVEFALVTGAARLRLVFFVAALAPALSGSLLNPPHGGSNAASFDYIMARHVDVAEYLPRAVPAGLTNYSEWAQNISNKATTAFYYPSLGKSSDGVLLDGQPRLRTLWQEWVGLLISLIGILGTLLFHLRNGPRRASVRD